MASPDYKELFESAPAAFLVLDKKLTIVGASDTYLQLTSRTREKILQKNIFDVFPDNPSDAEATGVTNLRKSLETVLVKKKADVMDIQRYDIKYENESDYNVRYWNPKNVPVLNSKGDVSYIIHTVEDITEFMEIKSDRQKRKTKNSQLGSLKVEMQSKILKRSQDVELANKRLLKVNQELKVKGEELKRSNTELANFAMVASHDIQAPFRIVGGYLGLIEEKLNTEGFMTEVKPHFEKIYGARERIKTLLQDLLQFAMVSKSDDTFEEVDLNGVYADVITNLEINIKEKNARVTLKGNLPVVKGERSQLLQLFQNLIANAIKFNTGEPVIEVQITSDKKEHTFKVKDNGLGIPQDYFEKIFEVFQRLNLQSEFPGTGLGLAICKKIVEHHKGKIWLESKTGVGTTFFVVLPAD